LKRRSKYLLKRQLGIPNLFIVGCGFVIVILISLYGLNYINYSRSMAGYSYLDLEEKYPVIKGDEIYDFMNQALFECDTILTDSMEFIKLNCFSLKQGPEIKSFINSQNDNLINKADKNFMKKQLSNNIYLWDNKKFKNVWCLTPKNLYKMNSSDTVDYWKEFKSNFGPCGHHHYSKPVFNETSNLCVIEHRGQNGRFAGLDEILLYKKVNGKWILIAEKNLWMI